MPFEESTDVKSEAMEVMKSRLSKFETEYGRLMGLSYEPRPNDIAITTTPKAGTTWAQQICHQLRAADTGGNMEFSEISEVVPWLELAHDQGQDLEAAQYGDKEGKPRFFKTHAWEEHCPSFPKTIVVLRDPYDVLYSFYKFFEDWFFEAGTISIDVFANEFWLARGIPTSKMQNASYFIHLISWYKRRHDPSVLIVFFEDMKQNLQLEVKRIAQFISTNKCNFNTDEIVAIAAQLSSYEFMKTNESKFDEKLSKLARNEACGLPRKSGVHKTKLADGSSGIGKSRLPNELKQKIDAQWRQIVEPVTGCISYEDLRHHMKN